MRLAVSVEDYYRFKAPQTLDDLIDAGTEWRSICPFCKHPNGKFYVNKASGLFKCFHCNQGGTVIKYHSLTKGISIEDAARELGEKTEIKPEVAVISELYIHKLHNDLKANLVALEQLKKTWHLTDEVIDKYLIGLKDNAVCVPIKNKRGDFVNIRYKKLFKQPGEKSFAWSHSDPEKPNLKFGQARLFPIDNVIASEVVFLCAGEKDCLSAIGMGLSNAITTTGGEGTFKDDFAFDLAGKKVFIVYDIDDIGKYDTKIVHESLKDIADAEIITLPAMPDYPDGTKRKDLTDYWRLGKTLNDFLKECNVDVNRRKPRHLPQLNKPRRVLPPLISADDKALLANLDPTFVDRYSCVSQELINSPKSYHRLCGLWVLSNLLGRSCHFRSGTAKIYGNLWVLITGATTRFHKSTTMEFAKQTLEKIDEDAIASTAFTPQGFWRRIQNRQDCLTSAVYYDEVAGMFDQMRADYNLGAKECLIKLYDCQPVRYDRAHDSIIIDHSYVTFLGGGIASRLAELLSWRDVELGFLGRFLVSVESSPNPYTPLKEPDYVQNSRINELVRVGKEIRARWLEPWKLLLHDELFLRPNDMHPDERMYQFFFTDEATERFVKFEQDVLYGAEDNQLIVSVNARLPSLCKKLCLLYAASDPEVEVFGPMVDIELKHLLLAIQDIQTFRPHMIELVLSCGLNESEKNIIRIFELVYRKPRITRTEIAKELKVSHKELTILLVTMLDRGIIREHRIDDTHSEYLIGF